MDGKSMIFGDVWDATMEQEAPLNELKCGVMGFSTIFTYFHLKTTTFRAISQTYAPISPGWVRTSAHH